MSHLLDIATVLVLGFIMARIHLTTHQILEVVAGITLMGVIPALFVLTVFLLG